MHKPKLIFFSCLLTMLVALFSCARWEFERTEFFQVITIGTVEIQANFAILIGDIANQRTATIIESGFVVSAVSDDENGLQLDKTNVLSFQVREQDSLTTNQAFAVNANGLNAATTYYFRAYAQLEEVEEIIYGEIDQFSTATPVIEIASVSKSDPGCQTTAEVLLEVEGLSPQDPETEVALVWTTDPNNSYPKIDNGNLVSEIGGPNTLLLDVECNQTYYIRAVARIANGAPIYSESYAFTTITNGQWQQKAAFPASSRFWPLAFAHKENGYIGGGVNAAGFFKDMWKYNHESNSWELIIATSDSLELAQGSAVVQDDQVYFLTGRKPYNRCDLDEACSSCSLCPCVTLEDSGLGSGYASEGCECYQNFVSVYSLTNNAWDTINPISFPSGQRSTFNLLLNGSNYLGGGQSIRSATNRLAAFPNNCLAGGQFTKRIPSNEFYQIEIHNSNFTFTQLSDIPGIRESRSIAIGFGINGKGYIGLGYGPDEQDFEPGPVLNDFYAFDPSQVQGNLWTSMADFPGGPTNGVGFALGNKGYVIAGDKFETKELWQFDPFTGAQGSWQTVATIPDANSAFLPQAYFVIGNQAYVYFDTRADNFWAYVPELE